MRRRDIEVVIILTLLFVIGVLGGVYVFAPASQ
jgi:hypothetical protein